jgi:hypothetical protein
MVIIFTCIWEVPVQILAGTLAILTGVVVFSVTPGKCYDSNNTTASFLILSGSTNIGHRYHSTLYSLVTDTTVNNLQKSAIMAVFSFETAK